LKLKDKVKILYIWDSDYPWDVRVEKICMSLMKNGHDVHIAARNLKKLSEYENIDGLHIHRMKRFKNSKVNYALSFPAFFSPFWRWFLDDIIRKNNIELIIVRDLPLAVTGIQAGKRYKIPVIFDMAENYVELIRNIWRERKFRGFNLLVRNPYLARIVERYAFKRFDHVLVVIDEAVDVAVNGGCSPEKVTVVGNTPPLSVFRNNKPAIVDDLELINKRYSAIYTGGIQMGRGIQVVLDAIPDIVKEIPEFLFVIVGRGYADEQLKKWVEAKKVQKYVCWIGWVDHNNIYSYIKASKIGLIPHFVSNHVNTTIPNKLFDYMGYGLSVIATDSIPMKRIMEEEQCGLTFESGNAQDLSKTVIELYRSEIDYGKNGIKAVQQKYNWEDDKKRLLEVIQKFYCIST
jgi:glycosyltransferase involved in cell wall biosynthesis